MKIHQKLQNQQKYVLRLLNDSRIFLGNRAVSLFYNYCPLTLCQVSGKSTIKKYQNWSVTITTTITTIIFWRGGSTEVKNCKVQSTRLNFSNWNFLTYDFQDFFLTFSSKYNHQNLPYQTNPTNQTRWKYLTPHFWTFLARFLHKLG